MSLLNHSELSQDCPLPLRVIPTINFRQFTLYKQNKFIYNSNHNHFTPKSDMCRHICDIIFSTFGLAHPHPKEKEDSMKLIHVLAALPFIGILLGIPFANKVTLCVRHAVYSCLYRDVGSFDLCVNGDCVCPRQRK